MICDKCQTDINMHISIEPHDIMHECLECGWYAIVDRKSSERTRYEWCKEQLAPIEPINRHTSYGDPDQLHKERAQMRLNRLVRARVDKL